MDEDEDTLVYSLPQRRMGSKTSHGDVEREAITEGNDESPRAELGMHLEGSNESALPSRSGSV